MKAKKLYQKNQKDSVGADLPVMEEPQQRDIRGKEQGRDIADALVLRADKTPFGANYRNAALAVRRSKSVFMLLISIKFPNYLFQRLALKLFYKTE